MIYVYYIYGDTCLPVVLGIILSTVRIILNYASLYYDSVKEPRTDVAKGKKPLFQLQLWDLLCHCVQVVSSQIMMEKPGPLF